MATNNDPLEQINLGGAADDGTGDTLRAGGTKLNKAICELQDLLAILSLTETSAALPQLTFGNTGAVAASFIGISANNENTQLSAPRFIDFIASDGYIFTRNGSQALTIDAQRVHVIEDISLEFGGTNGQFGQVLQHQGFGTRPQWVDAPSATDIVEAATPALDLSEVNFPVVDKEYIGVNVGATPVAATLAGAYAAYTLETSYGTAGASVIIPIGEEFRVYITQANEVRVDPVNDLTRAFRGTLTANPAFDLVSPSCYHLDASGAAFTLDLAAKVPVVATGGTIVLKKVDSSANAITITGLDVADVVIGDTDESRTFYYDGAGWRAELGVSSNLQPSDNFVRAGSLVSTVDGAEVFTFDTPFSSADGTVDADIIVMVTRTAVDAGFPLPVTASTLTGFTIDRNNGVDGNEGFGYIAVNRNALAQTVVNNQDVVPVEDREVTLIDVEGVNNTLYAFSTGETWAQIKANYEYLIFTGNTSQINVGSIRPYSKILTLGGILDPYEAGDSGAVLRLDDTLNAVNVWVENPSDADTGLTYRQLNGDGTTNNRMKFTVTGVKKQFSVISADDAPTARIEGVLTAGAADVVNIPAQSGGKNLASVQAFLDNAGNWAPPQENGFDDWFLRFTDAGVVTFSGRLGVFAAAVSYRIVATYI